MKAGNLIKKKGAMHYEDGVWGDLIALHVGEVPNGVQQDDHGHIRSSTSLDIFVIYASATLHGRWFADSSQWEVINETG